MGRKTYILVLIILCVAVEIICIRVVPLLESFQYPLVSSLTCRETEESTDLYWNINQIDIAGISRREDHVLDITLQNNIPDFDSYVFRMDLSETWHKTPGNNITVKLAGVEHLLQVKATNKLGEVLPAVSYRIRFENDRITIIPDEKKIIKGKYDFRFENTHSPKVTWLQQYTLPVIAASQGQWDTYLKLRKWVREQIPNRDPLMESQWDAQRILQAVWKDPGVGFICDAYAATYVSSCISAGLQARMLHLGDGYGRGHYATEVWSDDHTKWVFMDPLYDCYFTVGNVPLSALELHNRWKNSTWEGLEKQAGTPASVRSSIPSGDYFSLFKDIQLVNANDFLSTPFTSVFDLLSGRIRYIRWIDASNPPHNKLTLGCQLLGFYYLPKVIRIVILPFVIPGCVVVCVIMFFRKK
jgi:hypothetical protein